MMLEYMGWKEAAANIIQSLEATIGQKTVTYDLARGNPGARTVKTSEFADLLIKNLA